MIFKALIEALFRVLFSYDCLGEELELGPDAPKHPVLERFGR